MIITLTDGFAIDTRWDVEELKKHARRINFFTTFGCEYPDVWITTHAGANARIHFKHDKKTMTDIIEIRGDFADQYLLWKRSFWARGANK